MHDPTARIQALNTQESFIVQAPAGSGKTELIIQRYLCLLANVDLPSKIICVTFTKKATSEMRERIHLALTNARLKNYKPHTDHAIKTWQLAQQCCSHAQKLGWSIDDLAKNCLILTIDAAIAHWLSLAPPPYCMWGSYELISQPEPFYKHVTEDFLQTYCLHYDSLCYKSYQNLLLYHQCDQAYVISILYNALITREQWLPFIFEAKHNQSFIRIMRASFEKFTHDKLEKIQKIAGKTIAHLCNSLKRIHDRIPMEYLNLIDQNSIPDYNTPVEKWGLESWKKCIRILLTTTGSWRKRLQTKHGFLAASIRKKLHKSESLELENLHATYYKQLEILQDHKTLHIELSEIISLPMLEDNEWQSLAPLLDILPPLVAHLHVSMHEQKMVDFTTRSTQLLQAFEDEQSPKPLSLSIYQSLDHILIDEFQDTSRSQFVLFEKVVKSWQGETKQTITLVGDPMQSIYGFRQADVRLFRQVQVQGIAHLKPKPLYLSRNYRSDRNLVSWFNDCFNYLEQNNPIKMFHLSDPTRDYQDNGVYWRECENENDEAQAVCKTIQKHQLTNPNDSIAILVKARSHLNSILPILQTYHIDYQAIGIEYLSKNQTMLDCVTLSLLGQDLRNRAHWIALLRSPFCGLSWEDIHRLCQPTESIIWHNICENNQALSDHAQSVIHRIQPILATYIEHYNRIETGKLSLALWHALGGCYVLSNSSVYHTITTFFHEIDRHIKSKQQLNHTACIAILNSINIPNQTKSPNPVQVMTIHKAKGLQFDLVICPGLDRTAPPKDKSLVNIHTLTYKDNQACILHTYPKNTSRVSQLQNYLRITQEKMLEEEQIRLCYVAFTRAKKQLRLYYRQSLNDKVPARSWMKFLEAFIQQQPIKIEKTKEHKGNTQEQEIGHAKPNTYYALEKNWQHPVKQATAPTLQKSQWHHHDQSATWGDIIHAYLNTQNHKDIYKNNTRQQLMLLACDQGIHIAQQKDTIDWICKRIEDMHQDTVFQWIFKKRKICHHEQAILYQQKMYRIDRYFIEDDTLWVIDFKTHGIAKKQNSIAITNKTLDQYTHQLAIYHDALVALYPNKMIKTAIYFPLQTHWRLIEAKISTTSM